MLMPPLKLGYMILASGAGSLLSWPVLALIWAQVYWPGCSIAYRWETVWLWMSGYDLLPLAVAALLSVVVLNRVGSLGLLLGTIVAGTWGLTYLVALLTLPAVDVRYWPLVIPFLVSGAAAATIMRKVAPAA